MNSNIPILKIHPKDNIAVALEDLSKGFQIDLDGNKYPLVDDISIKHKFTCRLDPEAENLYTQICV